MATLSTYAETQTPIETPVVETPTPVIDSIIPETPIIETPVIETPVVEAPKEENVSDFSVGDEIVATPVLETPLATPPVFNLDEEIKKVDRKELLKKVGVTDFAIELDEHLNNGGKAEDYLGAKAIDYNQVSDEEMVKADIRKQYVAAGQKISQKQVDILFERKYTLAEDATDDDKELLDLQLKTDANNLRQSKITEQSKFQINHTPILHTDAAYEQWKTEQQSQARLNETMVNYFNNHAATKALNESKRVTISLGDGVEPFNFNINKPEVITQSLTDGGKIFSKLVSTATGEPDVAKQQLLTTFAFNPQKFMQDIFNYGVQMGGRKLVTEGQNATRPTTPVHSITGETAKYSTGTYGGGAKQ